LNFTSTNLESPAGPPQEQEEHLPPVWLQRAFVVVYVLFCMTLGLTLIALPWAPNWFDRGLIMRFPLLQQILQNGFMRGAISGLGIVDIWLGVLEAVHYHDRR
jgi:hypothetical protein